MKALKLASLVMVTGISMGVSLANASMALAIPKDASGKVGHTISISSMYQYNIENNTSSFQNYTGFEELEVNGKKHQNPINFSLPAYGRKQVNGDMISFGYMPDQVGDSIIRSSIKIMGMNGSAHNAHSTLTVSN